MEATRPNLRTARRTELTRQSRSYCSPEATRRTAFQVKLIRWTAIVAFAIRTEHHTAVRSWTAAHSNLTKRLTVAHHRALCTANNTKTIVITAIAKKPAELSVLHLIALEQNAYRCHGFGAAVCFVCATPMERTWFAAILVAEMKHFFFPIQRMQNNRTFHRTRRTEQQADTALTTTVYTRATGLRVFPTLRTMQTTMQTRSATLRM